MISIAVDDQGPESGNRAGEWEGVREADAGVVREVVHAIDADDDLRVAPLIARHWSYLIQHETPLVRQALDQLSHEVVDQHPAAGLVAELFQPLSPRLRKRGDRYLDRIVSGAGPDDDQLRASSGLIAVLALRRRGDHAAAARFGRRLVAEVESAYDPYEYRRPHLSTIQLQVGLASFLHGDLSQAEHCLAEAYRWQSTLVGHAEDAAGKLAVLYAIQGEAHLAQQYLERARAAAPPTTVDWLLGSVARTVAEVARMILAVDRLDWPAYHRHNRAVDPATSPEVLTLVFYARARAALLLGNQRFMIDRLHRFRSAAPDQVTSGNLPWVLLSVAEADLWLSLGDLDRAESLINQFGDHPLETVTRARLLLLRRDGAATARLVEEGRWAAGATRRDRVQLLLLAAAADLRVRVSGDARVQLLRRVAIELADEKEPWLCTLAVADRDLVDALAIEVPELAGLVDRVHALVPLPPFASGPAPVRITRREQLVLEHLASGVPAAEIAARLQLSIATIKNHRKNLYRKLNATSRDHATEIAERLGLIRS